MCMAYETKCSCGARSASFHFQDNILSEQIVRQIHCPGCATAVEFDPSTMVADNGWIICYDMAIASVAAASRIPHPLTPAVLFDGGFCTWNGVYPGDAVDSVRERSEITAIARTNPVEYLKKLKSWATDRMERLKHEGWRKAQNAA